MSETKFYEGILYQVEYQPNLSNNDYTKHYVYHIKTGQEDYCKAKKAIVSIMETEYNYKQGYLWTSGEYTMKNKKLPSMINALHPYYRFSYNEDLNVFVFTLVIPYDD